MSMNTRGKIRVGSGGFTLVETLVGSLVFIVVALAAYRAFGTLMDTFTISQARITAAALANERFEIMRNLPYEDVGVIASIPPGVIPRTINLTRDGYTFTVQTTIRNVDDPFDGTIGGNPADTSPADYKLADLDITCSNCKTMPDLKFTTLVSPHALETASTNGALFVQVFDAAGLPVSSASVHIVNTQTNPDTIIDEITDNEGWVRIIDTPPGTNAYNITATKEGYSQDETYPFGGEAGANPLKPDSTVVVQQVTDAVLSIDLLGSLDVSTVDNTCASTPGVDFSLTGTKLIGAPAVIKYMTQNFTTGPSGTSSISNMEWDTYNTALTSGAYDLAGSTPMPSFALDPGETQALQLVVVPHASHALLVSVQDANGVSINGATVRLQNTGFDETKITNSELCPTPGQVFWNGLGSGTYTLTVSASGYQDYTDNSLNLSPSWQNQVITLNP